MTLTDPQAAVLVRAWRAALADRALPVEAETLADAYDLEVGGLLSCDGEAWRLTQTAATLLATSDLLDPRDGERRRN